jgi:hypothetical protein
MASLGQRSISTLPSGPPTRQGCRLPSSDAALLLSLKNVCPYPSDQDTRSPFLSLITKSTLSPLNRQNLLLGQRAEPNSLLCQLQAASLIFVSTTQFFIAPFRTVPEVIRTFLANIEVVVIGSLPLMLLISRSLQDN